MDNKRCTILKHLEFVTHNKKQNKYQQTQGSIILCMWDTTKDKGHRKQTQPNQVLNSRLPPVRTNPYLRAPQKINSTMDDNLTRTCFLARTLCSVTIHFMYLPSAFINKEYFIYLYNTWGIRALSLVFRVSWMIICKDFLTGFW